MAASMYVRRRPSRWMSEGSAKLKKAEVNEMIARGIVLRSGVAESVEPAKFIAEAHEVRTENATAQQAESIATAGHHRAEAAMGADMCARSEMSVMGPRASLHHWVPSYGSSLVML